MDTSFIIYLIKHSINIEILRIYTIQTRNKFPVFIGRISHKLLQAPKSYVIQHV